MSWRNAVVSVITIGAATLAIVAIERRNAAQMTELRQQLAAVSTKVADNDLSSASDLRNQALLRFADAVQRAAPPAASRAPESAPRAAPVDASANNPALDEPQIRDRYEAAFITDSSDSGWTPRDKQRAVDRLVTLLPERSTLRTFDCPERWSRRVGDLPRAGRARTTARGGLGVRANPTNARSF